METTDLVTIPKTTYIEAYNTIMRAFLSLAYDEQHRTRAGENALNQLTITLSLLPNKAGEDEIQKTDVV